MLKAACALLLVAALLGGNPGGAGLHSAGGGALAGILGGAAAAAALPPEAAAGVRLPPLPNGFLFPVLAYGPNNQIAGLKEALVLGQLLNRTVIVHDILNHYTDTVGADEPHSMPFDTVFDFDSLAAYQSIVSIAEARAQGWDSRLDAVAHFGLKFLGQIKTAHALNVTDDEAEDCNVKGPFKCTPGELADIAERLERHRYVAFIVYQDVVQDSGHGVKLRKTGQPCHDAFLELSGQLRKSARLVGLAHEFLRVELQGAHGGYLAVHIRPYPDTCLHLWTRPQYNDKEAEKSCKNRNLFHVFVPQTAAALKRHGLEALFVMCHPVLRPKVSELYRAAGLQPHFYDEDMLASAVGYASVSLLGMLEEEVAFEADAFIGTSYSSMTSIINQERFARGKGAHVSYTFTKTS